MVLTLASPSEAPNSTFVPAMTCPMATLSSTLSLRLASSTQSPLLNSPSKLPCPLSLNHRVRVRELVGFSPNQFFRKPTWREVHFCYCYICLIYFQLENRTTKPYECQVMTSCIWQDMFRCMYISCENVMHCH